MLLPALPPLVTICWQSGSWWAVLWYCKSIQLLTYLLIILFFPYPPPLDLSPIRTNKYGECGTVILESIRLLTRLLFLTLFPHPPTSWLVADLLATRTTRLLCKITKVFEPIQPFTHLLPPYCLLIIIVGKITVFLQKKPPHNKVLLSRSIICYDHMFISRCCILNYLFNPVAYSERKGG